MMKNYLFVPFEKKDDAKAFGAKFDKQEKKWFVEGNVKDMNTKYKEVIDLYDIKMLHSKFEDKEIIKANGGKWDPTEKQWYTYKSNVALEQFFTP